MWTTIFNSSSNFCVVIVALSDTGNRVFVNMLLDVWTIDIVNFDVFIGARVDFVVDGMIGELARVFAGAIVSAVTGVDVDLLAGVSVNVVAAVMTALGCTMSASLEEWLFFCWAAFACWPTAVSDCDRALQACMPSYHVWSRFVLPTRPQVLNQEPPRPQQLTLPDFAMMPHLGHTELTVVVVTAGVYMWTLVKDTKRKTL